MKRKAKCKPPRKDARRALRLKLELMTRALGAEATVRLH